MEPRPPPAAASVVCSDVDLAAPRADCTARQTRCGEHGMSISVTPRWRTASSTALTTAGVDAIVPASPTPLTPSGLDVAGVETTAVSKLGRSAAEGSV